MPIATRRSACRRAPAFATGRYVHQIRFWDNAIPYDGSVPSWGHRLIEHGHRVTSIGKLHYRSTTDRNGFDEEIMPLHVVDGVGDLLGLDPRRSRRRARRRCGLPSEAGRGDSTYQGYDDRIADAATHWLRRSRRRLPRPALDLFVSFVCPHFPLIARPRMVRPLSRGPGTLAGAVRRSTNVPPTRS